LLFGLIDRLLAPAPPPARVAWLRETQFAHRGLHEPGTAENSLSAASAAIAHGLGIECDVQKSHDGKAIVFHDWELDRLTSKKGMLGARSADELGQIILTGSTDRIPTLRELLGLVRGQVPLLIEVKSKREKRPAPLCLAVRRVLEGYQGPHAVMSFDPRVANWFRHHSPRTVRGLVVSEEDKRTFPWLIYRHWCLWHAKPDFLAYDVRDFPSRFAAFQRARGIPVLTWTVRSAELRNVAAQYADAPIAEGAGVP
jgi:glycerophosphoryl diester phosphodiesterase